MTDLLTRLRGDTDRMVADLEHLVMVETPSEDIEAVRRGCAVHSAVIDAHLGVRPQVLEVDGRPHLLLQTGAAPRVMLLGHLDTVWPLGTTTRWPFASDGVHATGPGTFDMKAGIVQGLHALAMGLSRGDVALDDIALLLTTDEEIGSTTSRALIEGIARDVEAVLVLEPSVAGALKTARKGISMYTLEVIGRAAHAGLEPDSGINALLELAAQLPHVAAIADRAADTTVTPTRARAGSTINTVPAAAHADIDVRAWSVDEQQRVDVQLRALQPSILGAALTLHGGINRPPLEASAAAALDAHARRCARDLGLPDPGSAAVGGGSDGNFTGALGIPTLDGLGAVGDGAHAEGEHVVVSAMAERAALVHRLLVELLADPSPAVGGRLA